MPLIEVSNLRKEYRNHVAVQDVSFSVEEGEIFGILGPNGAGKTTAVECIEGMRKRDGGEISVMGLDPLKDKDLAELRESIGIQLQQSELPPKMKVWEALELYSTFYRDPVDWRELIKDWGLSGKADTAYGSLSGGQQQRLSIALALVGKPRIAVFDELTTALDPHARRETWKLIEKVREQDVTVLLVTHFMEEAERLCDRIAIIESGRVVALDTPSGLVSRVDEQQIIRFKPSVPMDDELLTSLPEVSSVTRSKSQVTVVGKGNVVYAVISVLARNQIVANELRLEQASLDDAFVALTGSKPAN
ncbi:MULTISPECIES: ABC transporter ATP-binding protein [Streptomyces]|jgi:ABC-2 type transport system ATP-binding protein|uniref:ABC-type xenobiotic transporter n=7 Tax=Streptomyces violaceusniger group TaxID=2839105 RepID=A0A0A0NET4_STRRN|nr:MULTISPECIES: ABC transporter ATP-binding protein [Streptomyces]AGP52915.1 sulfate ABC transporter ATPase [Streptomyces rapamycinicus NRRL 5491]EXU62915.1 sulfate ABC transporter ATPase [Streptomyces sp. PRh5]MBA6435778.1 ABC transporter ATP-binding protein [Streptomyces sp. GMR22]MBB4780393.1 ABC-2 type transport system ATP-binding protein [Streptomyces rapamycinicus]MBD3006898.1 ABC transporter ATP-binding protein [Streptomyces sp. 5-10]